MNNPDYRRLYSELLAYLDSNGQSLIQHGSAERGLSFVDARAFLDLLFTNKVPLLGIEIWRGEAGRYSLDGTETWYSVGNDLAANHADAVQYMSRLERSNNDVFTVQFGTA